MDVPIEEEVKSMIRSVLTSNPLSLNILQMCQDYMNLVGAPIPFKHFGYSSVENYLRSIPDTVFVKGNGILAELTVVTAKSAHIGAMVEKQKITRKRGPMMKRRRMVLSDASQKMTSLGLNKAQNQTYRERSFGPDKVQKSQISPKFERTVTPVVEDFFTTFKNRLNGFSNEPSPPINCNQRIVSITNSNLFEKSQKCDLESQENCQSSPECDLLKPKQDYELSLKCESKPLDQPRSFRISNGPKCDLKFKKSDQSTQLPTSNSYPRKEKQSKAVKINEYKYNTGFRIRHDEPIPLSEKLKLVEVKDEFPLKNTNVPKHLQRNLKELVESCPNGILCTRMPELFRTKFHKDFKYERYRYTSLIELLSSLPHLVEYKAVGKADYLVYKAGSKVPDYVECEPADRIIETKSGPKKAVWEQAFDPKSDWSMLPIKVPENVLHFGDKISIFFDRGWKIGDTLHILMGEIFDLSKFWIAIEDQLDKLMKDLQLFFTYRKSEYSIPRMLLRVHLYCVSFYLKHYHRCYVLDLLQDRPDYILVYFIDYGTTDLVSIKNCYYLPKEFAEIPCQAIRARLSNVMPPIENDVWSVQAIQRFAGLTKNTKLVAEIIEIEEDNILEIYLADVLVESSIYFINEAIVDEGYAVYAHQKRIKPLFEDPDCIPLVKYLHLYPSFQELEDGSFQRDMNYIQNNNIPAHQYMPTYFHITLPGRPDDLKAIEKAFEGRNKPMSNLKIGDDIEYGYDDLYLKELEELLNEEENASIEQREEKVEISSAAKRRAHLMSLDLPEESTSNSIPDGESTHSSNLNNDDLNVKNEPLSPSYCTVSTFSEKIENITNRQFLPNSNNIVQSSSPLHDTNPFRSTNPFLVDLERTILSNHNLSKTPEKSDIIDTPKEPELLSNTQHIEKNANTNSKKISVVNGTQTEKKRKSPPPGFSSKLPPNPPFSSVNLNCNASQYVPRTSTSTLNYNAPQYFPTNSSGFHYNLSPAAPRLNLDTPQFIPDHNALTNAMQYTALVNQLNMMQLYNYNIQPQYSSQNYQLWQALAALQNGYQGSWQDVAGALPPAFQPPGPR